MTDDDRLRYADEVCRAITQLALIDDKISRGLITESPEIAALRAIWETRYNEYFTRYVDSALSSGIVDPRARALLIKPEKPAEPSPLPTRSAVPVAPVAPVTPSVKKEPTKRSWWKR